MHPLPEALALELSRTCAATPRCAVQTLGHWVFGAPGTRQRTAPLWVARTDGACWIIACDPDNETAPLVAGVPEPAHLARGWLRDTLCIGDWRLTVPKTTREVMDQLGAPIDPAEPPIQGWTTATHTAPVAPGARDVPQGLARAIQTSPHGRWLVTVSTASTAMLAGMDGMVRRVPIRLAIGDSAAALVALQPNPKNGPDAVTSLSGPMTRRAGGARSVLESGAFSVVLPMIGASRARRVAQWLELTPEERWLSAVELALHDEAYDDAMDLVAEAFDVQRAPLLGVLAARLCHRAGAAVERDQALHIALMQDPTALNEPPTSLSSPVKRPPSRLSRALQQVAVPPRPADVPEPSTLTQACIVALLSSGAGPRADALLDGRTDPWSTEVRASRSQDASVWRDAAARWRAAGHKAAEERCVRKVLDGSPGARDLWIVASWSWEDGDQARAMLAWRRALSIDPLGLQLAIDGLDDEARRALADLAEATAPQITAAALRASVAANPLDHATTMRLADLLAHRLHAPDAAAASLEALANRLGDAELAAPAAWTLYRDAAALRTGHARVATLEQAIRADFLTPEAWTSTLSLAEGDAEPAKLQWWRHLARVVAGPLPARGDASPRPASPTITTEDLDALHPSGMGWLDALKQALAWSPTALDREDLVRGLQPLAEEHAHLLDDIGELSSALGIRAPEAFIYRGAGSVGVAAQPTQPPVLLIGAEHLREGRRSLSREQLRFLWAVELTHLAARHPILDNDPTLLGTSRSVYAAFGAYSGAAETVVDLVSLVPGIDQLSKLQRVLIISRRLFAARNVLDKAGSLAAPLLHLVGSPSQEPRTLAREGLEGAALQLRIHADRAALLLTGDLDAAVSSVLLASSEPELAADYTDHGLAHLLSRAEAGIPADLLVRLGSLVGFASRLNPDTSNADAAVVADD